MDDEIEERAEKTAAIAEVFDRADVPALTARDFALELNLPQKEVRNRLKYMEANGMVQKKNVDQWEHVWWPTARPKLEPEAQALLLDPDQEEPLSVDQIREIVCED